jgi:hypothetical protein
MPTDPSFAELDELVDEAVQDTPENPVETEAPVEDTPTAHEDPAAPIVDYEKRYKDLQAEFTRRAQRDAERDEQLQQYEERLRALQERQPTPQYDDDDDVFIEDPSQHPAIQAGLQRIAAIEAQLTQQHEQNTLASREAEDYAHIDGELERIERQLKVEFNDDESRIIGREALANRDPLTGKPDVEVAYAAYMRALNLEERKKQWVDSKRGAGAPASGPGAVAVPDLDDPQQLEEYLDRAFSGQ